MASKLKPKSFNRSPRASAPDVPALEQRARSTPNDPRVLCELGAAYRLKGQFEEAATTLVRAVALEPGLAATSFELGLTLRELKEPEPALACFTRATDVEPSRFEYQLELAHELGRAERCAEAIGHYQCALALCSSSLPALIGLSYCLRQLARYEGSCVVARRAITAAPTSPAGHHELGRALSGLGRNDAAIASLRRALDLSPEHADAHFGIGVALSEVGELGAAIGHFRRSLALRPTDRYAHSNLIFMQQFAPETTGRSAFDEARAWARSYAEPFEPSAPSYSNTRVPDRRLRLGYVAPTFRNHCQAQFLQPLLSHHDHSQFEIFCYSSSPVSDDVTSRLKAHTDQWRAVRTLEDEALAELVRRDGIDLLVDLNMHMAESRLGVFARRPAPVQLTWLAYPGTTGLRSIDYRISDRYLDPPDADLSVYSEQTLRLPDAFWCYDPLCDDLGVSPLPCARNGHVTFGCLNAFWKQNSETFQLWSQVLKAVPRSRLVVLAPPGGAETFVRRSFVAAGIEAERVECVPRQPRRAYLETYQRIDICLDTIPYNGHTTSLDALWMGVPVVTLVGERVVGRAGFCQATILGLPELIAHGPGEFVERARTLAFNAGTLGGLRSRLRGLLENSALMDAPRFALNLEGLYREAWRRWCAAPHQSTSPQSFTKA
jgi:protein O-GlcNAc transferase